MSTEEASPNGAEEATTVSDTTATATATAAPQAVATADDDDEITIDDDDDDAPIPSFTAVLEAANTQRKLDEQVDEILADTTTTAAIINGTDVSSSSAAPALVDANLAGTTADIIDNGTDNGNNTGPSTAPATLEDLAEALSDGEEPFFETNDNGSDDDDDGTNKPAYTAETAAAISSLMAGEQPSNIISGANNNNGGLINKREISLQDRAQAMISVYHDFIQEEGHDDDVNNNNDGIINVDGQQCNPLPDSHDLRRAEIKVATLEKFCKDLHRDNYADDDDDDESLEPVQDDDYYDRLHTIQYPSQPRKPPKPTFRGPTAATTTAAFRLKAEVALKAVSSKTKKVTQRAVGAVKTKVKDGMSKGEDIREGVREVEENDYDFQEYDKKMSGEYNADDLEYGIANNEPLQDQKNGDNEGGGDGSQVYGMHILDRDNSLKRKIRNDDDDSNEDEENIGLFNDLCDELGVTTATHPNLHNGLHHFYPSPNERTSRYKYPIFRTKKFKQAMLYCGALLLLLLISISIISAVSNGFEDVRLKNKPALPDWKEEDDWREKQKEGWEKDHPIADNVGGHDPAKVGITSQQQQQDGNTLFQRVSAAYRPVWYDRSTGWTGQTYGEAMTWCDSHDHYIPCPYEVYCPDETTLLAGVMDRDGESWAPVINAENEWVQVGNAAGRECDLYSTLYGKPPDWGGEENAEEVTRHIMCCREHPDYDDGKEGGEHVMRPDGPPSTTNTEEEELSVTKSEELDILFLSVTKTYNPIWFDRTSGWKGQTYQESLDFCSKMDGYIPCPLKVYCPGGHGILLDGHQDEGESWAAVIDTANDWVQVGEGGVCNLYSETAKGLPSWGVTGEKNEEITRHIMCCDGSSHMSSIIVSGNDSTDATTNDTDTSLAISNNGQMPQPQHALTELEAKILNEHHPVWFNSDSSGWEGTTYNDAKAFCESTPHGANVGGGTYHLCPLSAYCPNGPTDVEPLYLQMEAFFEGVQWAPLGGADNGWVMVGTFNNQEELTCQTYLQINHHEPDWGLDGTSPQIKKHILCCEDNSDIDDNASANEIGSTDVTAADEANTDASAISNNEDATAPSLVTMPEPNHALTELEVKIYDLHHPKWFSDTTEWKGTTHDDAKAFCESISYGYDEVDGGTYHLCPLSAYCPNGETNSEPLYLQMEAFEGVQWAPISSADNGWVMVGDVGDLTCKTYLQINHHEPEWGLDGTSPQIKNHILCCGDVTDVVIQPEVHENLNESDTSHDAAEQQVTNDLSSTGDTTDNTVSSDVATNIKEPASSMTTLEIQIRDAHRPAWFSTEFGWQGTNYQDAKTFCESIPYKGGDTFHLCPLAAYCPNGPRDSEPLYLQMDPFDGVQWAPISNGDNAWVMVGNVGDLTCQTYSQINNQDPVWGLDGSSTQLKEHLLCCEDGSGSDDATKGDEQASNTPSDGGDKGDGLTDMAVSIQEGVVTSDGSTDANNGSEGGVGNHAFENSITITFNPMWFDLDQGGWGGGSHDEAIQFCEQFAGSHGKKMELCPYAAYCPQGPSQPVIGGHEANFEEEGEQWAPVFGQKNHWVMIGKRGANFATTCLSHLQLTGEEPSWGLDGSNKEMKKHVMCCSPLQ